MQQQILIFYLFAYYLSKTGLFMYSLYKSPTDNGDVLLSRGVPCIGKFIPAMSAGRYLCRYPVLLFAQKSLFSVSGLLSDEKYTASRVVIS